MTIDLRVTEWKLLRILVRAKGRPVTGRRLRHTPTRLTRDGAFLGKLVAAGLLAVSEADADPFKATYTLTPLGKQAAEYGEYDAGISARKREPGA